MATATSEGYRLKHRLGFFLGLIAFVAILLLPRFGGIEPMAQRTLAVAALMAIWWITEAAPLAVTALLPLLLYPLLGIANAQSTAVNYGDKNIFLFIGGFLLAFGLERWGLHRRFALKIISLIGGQPARLLFAFMLVTWFLSMWISNTATTLMMLPIGMAVLAHLTFIKDEGANAGAGHLKELLMLGIAYAASIGGISTLIGTPPNIILKGYLEKEFPAISLSFAKWTAMVLPFSLVFLVILWFYLLKVLPPGRGVEANRDYLHDFTIPGWSHLFPWPKLFHDSTVAMGMALLCFILPADWRKGVFLLTANEIKRLPWHIILLFGGGFALAFGIKTTHLDVFIGHQLGFLHLMPLFVVIAGIALMLTFLTEITSNTATTSALLPVIGPLAIPLGLNPMLLLMPATLNASFAFMLPVATPPNAIVFGSGYIRMDTMVRVGFWLNLIGVLLTTAFVMLVKGFL
ncbi:MAG: hypothetical protein B1H03_07555 [Planctomycetales bacterium 4484_113]|nr:MAG: hypothetical protein B1H03_07555 [Planctomycetales bacterium 4484_113]